MTRPGWEPRVLYDSGPTIRVEATGDPTCGGLCLTVGEQEISMSLEVARRVATILSGAVSELSEARDGASPP